MSLETDAKISSLLKRILGDGNVDIHPDEAKDDIGERFAKLDLPSAPGAEYFFRVWFHEDSELQISAHLIQHRSDDTYFWYRSFEMAEFNGSQDDLVTEFCEELEALLTHETRIVQRKGWLFSHFRCDYRTGEKWKSVCSQSAFRGGKFKTPKIMGRKQIYHSAALANVRSQF
jgi:hypothetical protein